MEADDGVTLVRRLDTPFDSVANSVTVLEVNRDAGESGSLVPVPFAPSGEIPFSTTVIELSPSEYEQLKGGQLPLPDGWALTEDIFSRS